MSYSIVFFFQFRDTTITAECLYSLINGDDMYNTYAIITTKSGPIWVYSKAYLYIFISLFIYVVLSLFIGIISDTYERLKVRVSIMVLVVMVKKEIMLTGMNLGQNTWYTLCHFSHLCVQGLKV